MWNLEDHSLYFRLFDITIPHAFTWGDGNQAKREDIRAEVAPRFPATIPRARWWAFRLCAKKGGRASFDVENIPKLIVDAFSGKMLRQGGSQYPRLELYGEDTVDRVGMVQVAGEAFEGGDSTRGEVLGRRFG